MKNIRRIFCNQTKNIVEVKKAFLKMRLRMEADVCDQNSKFRSGGTLILQKE
jgi:hypothetical protein